MESADLQLHHHHHHHHHQQLLEHQIPHHQVVAGSSSSTTLPTTTRPCYTNSTLSTVGNDHRHASLPPPPNHNNLLLNNLRCQQENNGSHHQYPPPNNNSNNSPITGSDHHHHHHQAVGINWPSSHTNNSNININNSSWESCFISTSNPSSPYQNQHQYLTNTRHHHHHHQDHLLDTSSPSSPPFQKFNDLLSPPSSQSCGGAASPQDHNTTNNEDGDDGNEEEAEQQRRQQLSTDLSEKLLLKTLMMTTSSNNFHHHHNQLIGGGVFRAAGPGSHLPNNNDNYGAENTMPSCNVINNNNKSWNLLSHINILPSVNISSLSGNNNSNNGHISPNNSGRPVEMVSNNNNHHDNSQAPLGLFPMAPRILNSSGTTTTAGRNTAVLGRYSHLLDYNTSLIAPFDKDSTSTTLSQSEIDHQHLKHRVSTQKKKLNNDNINNVSAFKNNSNNGVPASTNNKRASSCNPTDPKATQNAPKRPRPASCPPFKVRKEKLGDRIAALQQLVAPFGKTDTASVLMEAIGYIKFLQSQVETLSVPYMKLSRRKSSDTRRGVQGADTSDGEGARPNLRSRGLCLVPASCMSYINSITTTTTTTATPAAAPTGGSDPHGGVGGCNIWPPLSFNPNVTTYHM